LNRTLVTSRRHKCRSFGITLVSSGGQDDCYKSATTYETVGHRLWHYKNSLPVLKKNRVWHSKNGLPFLQMCRCKLSRNDILSSSKNEGGTQENPFLQDKINVKLKEGTSNTPELSRVSYKKLDSCPKKSCVALKKRAFRHPEGPRIVHKKLVDDFTDDTNFRSSRRDESFTQVTAPLQSRIDEIYCQRNGFPLLQNSRGWH
jgi:hypothetical protein